MDDQKKQDQEKTYSINKMDEKLYRQLYKIKRNKRCNDCGVLIKFTSLRCRGCETKCRWVNGLIPPMKANKTSFKKGQKPWNTGKNISGMSGKKQSLKHRSSTSGKNSHFWKGGITPEHVSIRKSYAYKQWRNLVFKRDNYTCQQCKHRGGILQADHIKPFAYFPELRLNINNGRTLCIPCHKLTETYGEGVHNIYGQQ